MQTLIKYSNGSMKMMDKQTSVSYIASFGTAAGGFFSLNNIALILGILFAAATFCVTWYTNAHKIKLEKQKRKEDAEFHQARMLALMHTSNDGNGANE